MCEETKTKEYEMLRQEIMQYLEEYQNVRNMMYIITATLLGFGLANEKAVEYVYLLPLIVIIPSFFIYVDYCNGIIRDAVYLRVFYEENSDFPIKWESQLEKYKLNEKEHDWQKVPYILSAYASLGLYFISMEKSVLNFVIGIGIAIACSVVFLKVKEVKYSDVKQKWEEVKNG